MKTLLFSFVLVALNCNGVQQAKNSIEGTWELVNGTSIERDSTLVRPLSPHWKSIKMIDKNYYVTIWQDTTASGIYSSGFNGGKYVFEKGVYTEQFEFLV